MKSQSLAQDYIDRAGKRLAAIEKLMELAQVYKIRPG